MPIREDGDFLADEGILMSTVVIQPPTKRRTNKSNGGHTTFSKTKKSAAKHFLKEVLLNTEVDSANSCYSC